MNSVCWCRLLGWCFVWGGRGGVKYRIECWVCVLVGGDETKPLPHTRIYDAWLYVETRRKTDKREGNNKHVPCRW